MTADNPHLRADLHIHTLASDGADTVREVLQEARRAGVAAISITDHDSVDSVEEAIALAPEFGVEVIPGIEISVELNDAEMHLLGYFIDYRDPEFLSRLVYLRDARARRAEKMIELLREMNFPLDMEALLPGQMSGAVGRLHLAQAMLEAGYVASPAEAFEKYIGNRGPAHIPKIKIELAEAMNMILRVGGAPVLAHPRQFGHDELIPEMISRGLVGLEVYYPSHSRAIVNHYLELADRYGLLATGGSDCHGRNRENILIGAATAPYSVVAELRARAEAGFSPPPLTPNSSPPRGEREGGDGLKVKE